MSWDEPYREREAEPDAVDDEDAPWLAPAIPYGWPLSYGPGTEESEEVVDEDEGWWDEGLITLLLVAGVVLFLFPEPVTSSLGILLLMVGGVMWIFDFLS